MESPRAVRRWMAYSQENEAAIHKAIKKVSDDIEAMKFNTAIAALMALVQRFLCQRRYQGRYESAAFAALALCAPYL